MPSLSTKENIIAIAEYQIQQHGYNAFSYHDIASELGVKNAAIHYHFPKKEDLLEEVINKAQRNFQRLAEKSELEDSSHMQKLFRFLKIYDDNLDRDNRVCLIGSLATDFFTLPGALHPQLESLVVTLKVWLSDILEQGRKKNEFQFAGSSEDRAALICSSMAGALQLARVLGNDEYQAIKSLLINDIKI